MKLKSESDRVLLEKVIHSDDQKAFKIFFNRYYFRLVGFSLFFVKAHENAEDVVEEVFYKFLKSRGKVLDINNIQSYLFRMAKNESLNFLKKNKHTLQHDHYESVEDYQFQMTASPEYQVEGEEFEALINELIDAFPPKRKVIFNLSREERLSYIEIAELLDVSVKTVESHMTVALKLLRDAVMDYDASLDTKTRKMNISTLLILALPLLF